MQWLTTVDLVVDLVSVAIVAGLGTHVLLTRKQTKEYRAKEAIRAIENKQQIETLQGILDQMKALAERREL